MKINILFDDYNANMPQLAQAMSEAISIRCEHVPPAFPPKEMKVVFLCAELKNGKLSPKMKSFLPILTPAKTASVAIVTCGKKQDKGQEAIKEIMAANGVKVVDVFTCVGKKEKGVVPEASDIERVKEFAEGVVKTVFNRD